MFAELVRILGFSALTSGAAVLIVLALRRPMRLRFGAWATYAIWLLVPAAALVALLPARVVDVEIDIGTLARIAPAAPSAASANAAAAFDLAWLAAGIWLAGACGMALVLVLQQRRFVRSLGRLAPLGSDLVCAEASAGCPALIGVWRPRIVLPSDFEQRYDRTERELVLAHERMHRVRGDAQANALAALLRCLYWFNPLVHVAAARFRFDQELACDAAVIARFPQARRPYAEAMLKTQLADLALPAGCHWQSSHPLTERIAMLKRPLPGRARAALGFALAAALVAGGSFAAWAAQPPNETKTLPSAAAEAGDHPASYRRISRIEFPAGVTLHGDCVGVVTYEVGATGNIANLLSLTLHGSAPQETCGHLINGAAASILAKQWTFEPAVVHGAAVTSKVIVPIVFTDKADDAFDNSVIPPEALDAIRVSAPPPKSAAAAKNTSEAAFLEGQAAVYPPAAIAAHQQGRIVVKVDVDAAGKPLAAAIASAEPPQARLAFGDASIAAVMGWKYQPRIDNGRAVASETLVPFDFVLED